MQFGSGAHGGSSWGAMGQVGGAGELQQRAVAALACPLTTPQPRSLDEAGSTDVPEIKAYKLGKRRWSYNQCELVVRQEGGTKMLGVAEAMQIGNQGLGESQKDSGVAYQIRLTNHQRIRLHVYVVYDTPVETKGPGKNGTRYQWTSVTRAACKKGCQGPILRAIQRFGRLGRRSGGPAAAPVKGKANDNKEKLKDARFLYLSVDEAGTHVGVRRFRLVVGVWDHNGQQLLGSSVSPPIRVLANNDVPSGAAYITLNVPVGADWEGWNTTAAEKPGRMLTGTRSSRGGTAPGLAHHASGSLHPPLDSTNGSPITPGSDGRRTRSNSSSETSLSLSHRAHGGLLDSPDMGPPGRGGPLFRSLGQQLGHLQDDGHGLARLPALSSHMLLHFDSGGSQLGVASGLLADLPVDALGGPFSMTTSTGSIGSLKRARSDPLATPDMHPGSKRSASPSPALAKQLGTPMYPATYPPRNSFPGLDDEEHPMLELPGLSEQLQFSSGLGGHHHVRHGHSHSMSSLPTGPQQGGYVHFSMPAHAFHNSEGLQNLFSGMQGSVGSGWQLRQAQPLALHTVPEMALATGGHPGVKLEDPSLRADYYLPHPAPTHHHGGDGTIGGGMGGGGMGLGDGGLADYHSLQQHHQHVAQQQQQQQQQQHQHQHQHQQMHQHHQQQQQQQQQHVSQQQSHLHPQGSQLFESDHELLLHHPAHQGQHHHQML